MSEEIKVTLAEVEVQKLNLQPGDKLMITVKSDEFTNKALEILADNFRKLCPNNTVAFFAMGSEGDIKFTTIKDVAKPVTASYCNDCSCGKKEAYEEQNG